jgi:hypothetical protein
MERRLTPLIARDMAKLLWHSVGSLMCRVEAEHYL